MQNDAHSIGQGMHSVIGGVVATATMAMVAARQEAILRQDHNAHLDAVAANARVAVLRKTTAELREDLEDAREDLALASQVNASLLRQVTLLTQERDALRARRAA